MILYYILVPLAWLVFHIGFRVRCEGRENLKKNRHEGLHHCPQPHLRHRPGVRRHHPVLGSADDRVCQERAVRDKPIPVVVLPVRRCSLCPRHERRGQRHRRHREKVSGGRYAAALPGGTREQEGKFLPLKSGLFVIAAAANVDVVPCRIYYNTPDGKMKLFCKVRVIFGEPMPAAQFAMEGRRDIKKLRGE